MYISMSRIKLKRQEMPWFQGVQSLNVLILFKFNHSRHLQTCKPSAERRHRTATEFPAATFPVRISNLFIAPSRSLLLIILIVVLSSAL